MFNGDRAFSSFILARLPPIDLQGIRDIIALVPSPKGRQLYRREAKKP